MYRRHLSERHRGLFRPGDGALSPAALRGQGLPVLRAIDPQRGVNDTGDTTANVRQTVIENADCVYLLADHTKFGKSGFITVCGIDRLDFVITDQPLDREWKKLFSENGVTVLDGSHE